MSDSAGPASDVPRGRLYVALAAVAWSSAGVIQRTLSADPATQIAGRAAFACIGILAFVAAGERRATLRAFRGMGRTELGFAVCIALSSSTFLAALNDTSVANVLVLQAAAPLLAAALGWLWLRERVAAQTWLAMLVALGGVGIMVGGPGGGVSAGLSLAVISCVAFATGIVLARRRSDISMAPASFLAQLLVVVSVAPWAHPGQIGLHDLVLLVALGIGQVGLGLVLLTLGARLIPAAEVALLTLLEVVLGPLWVWLARGESPALATLVGGLVILVAVVIGTLKSPRQAVTVT